jgi:preprotein translocase subunit SecA
MRLFGGETVSRMMSTLNIPEDVPIESGLISKAIESAQTRVEGHNFDIRKSLVDYDDVMNKQRQIIYGLRDKILEQARSDPSGLKETILGKLKTEVSSLVEVQTSEHGEVDHDKLMKELITVIPFDDTSQKTLAGQISGQKDADKIKETLSTLAVQVYEAREKSVGESVMRQVERFVILNVIDSLWIEHLDTIDDLRQGIGLRGYGQRDPLIEYKHEAYNLFERLVATIDFEVARRILRVNIQIQNNPPPAALAGNVHPTDSTKLDELKSYSAKHHGKLNKRMRKIARELEQRGVKV